MSVGILNELERELTAWQMPRLRPLPIDRWLAASVLQKSVRRGDTVTAQKSALTLWKIDPRACWTRIFIISLEDCGVASTGAITKTMIAFNEAWWRKKVGDLKVALYLTQLLCEAEKTRLADEVYSIAGKDPSLQKLRLKLAKAKDSQLVDMVLDNDLPLPERCLALWFLAGTKRYPADGMPLRVGNIEETAKVLRSLKADKELTEACIGSLKKSQWPLALFTPLLWLELKRQSKTILSWHGTPCPTPFVRGVPMAALDGFTRLGRQCFQQLKQENPIFNRFTAEQIRLAVFYLQGRCLDKRVASLTLDEYRDAGELADMHAAGLSPTRYAELKTLVKLHLGVLDDIRQRRFKSYRLEGGA